MVVPTITLYTWPVKNVPATEIAIFYFPGCNVERALDKDIRIISMSGITKVIDLLRTDDSLKISGSWLNDDNAEYDGLTTMVRQEFLYEYCTVTELYAAFTWDDNTYSETLYLLPHTLNCDQEPGNVGIFTINFLFAVLAKEPSA